MTDTRWERAVPNLMDTIVTTVPLSVSYGGAKPIGPWLRTSNFVPCG